jgi:hypothetical protein
VELFINAYFDGVSNNQRKDETSSFKQRYNRHSIITDELVQIYTSMLYQVITQR